MTAYFEADNSFALLDNFEARQHLPDYVTCHTLDVSPQKYFAKSLALVVAKGSPLGPHFNFHIKRMMERGALDQINQRY